MSRLTYRWGPWRSDFAVSGSTYTLPLCFTTIVIWRVFASLLAAVAVFRPADIPSHPYAHGHGTARIAFSAIFANRTMCHLRHEIERCEKRAGGCGRLRRYFFCIASWGNYGISYLRTVERRQDAHRGNSYTSPWDVQLPLPSLAK